MQIVNNCTVPPWFFTFLQSKPYSLTGWRIGWVCGNYEVVNSFAKLKSTIDSGIFKAIQIAGAEILNSPEGDEYIKFANNEIKKKSDYFVKAFKEEWSEVMSIYKFVTKEDESLWKNKSF